jgi:hypothetical protein
VIDYKNGALIEIEPLQFQSQRLKKKEGFPSFISVRQFVRLVALESVPLRELARAFEEFGLVRLQ